MIHPTRGLTFGAGLCDRQGDTIRVNGEGVVRTLEVGIAPFPLQAGQGRLISGGQELQVRAVAGLLQLCLEQQLRLGGNRGLNAGDSMDSLELAPSISLMSYFNFVLCKTQALQTAHAVLWTENTTSTQR